MVKDWIVEGDKVRLVFAEGQLFVSLPDFNRAFGAIINSSYEAVKRDFAIS